MRSKGKLKINEEKLIKYFCYQKKNPKQNKKHTKQLQDKKGNLLEANSEILK